MHRKRSILTAALFTLIAASVSINADEGLLKTHCAKCHKDFEPKGDFSLRSLETSPTNETIDLWEKCLEYVRAKEMPPEKTSRLSDADRRRLIQFLDQKLRDYNELAGDWKRVPPRRLNNRELANSVSDVLMIEDVGTHQPTANLLGDTLHDGFDTNGDALGMSLFHLEQYIDAFRKIVDATILSGERPATIHTDVKAGDMVMTSRSQTNRTERANRTRQSIDFLDHRLRVYFSNFKSAPATGRYRIKIRVTGKDRGVYDSAETGVYDGDPIQLNVHLGDRVRVFDLPDEEVMEIELDEWIAAGTRLELSYPTDGLRKRGNGNFKFQYSIAHDHIKSHDPELYAKVLREIVPNAPARTAKQPAHWSHWTDYWQGPRPRLFSAEIEGPIYESWPPKRQVTLLGQNPKLDDAVAILRPIAERAWRRDVLDGELDPIARLVKNKAETLGDVEALKEGIVAVLASPAFLLINPDNGLPADRFATKLSYLLQSTTPNARIRAASKNGRLDSFESVRDEVQRQFDRRQADEFLRQFPHSWLQLDRISFMAPDPERFPLYERKRLSEDMTAEVLQFFRHAIDNNLPVPELLAADYSFINADLAIVYEVDDVPEDSKLRKYTFTDGRRGGFFGMGAFLTLTADSLGTSPIHRAVYVMENFMGIHPTPPPPDVKITEPDVRQAKTIKEILAAHMADPSCASCHQRIDPFGYAFENFGPMGEWRDNYKAKIAAIPVDASAKFRSGEEYHDIIEYRNLLLSDSNRDRFVRCFITKLLTYANGIPPDNYSEVEAILKKSAENEYRIVDTIAAVIDSPLFRED